MKRYLAALAIGGAVFGTVLASAATLGTITDGTLGASDAAVDGCQELGLSTNYVAAWDATDNRYEVTSVEVNGLTAACAGKRIGIVLVDSLNAKLAENSTSDHLAPVPGTGAYPAVQTFALTPAAPANPSVASVEGVRLTIYGD